MLVKTGIWVDHGGGAGVTDIGDQSVGSGTAGHCLYPGFVGPGARQAGVGAQPLQPPLPAMLNFCFTLFSAASASTGAGESASRCQTDPVRPLSTQ